MPKSSTKSKRGNLPVYRSTPSDISVVDHVAGLVNPFSSDAKGSKIHDANGARTFTLSSISSHAIPTGVSGNGYAEFYPALKVSANITNIITHIPSSLIMPAAPTVDPFDIAEYTDLNNNTSRYRIVSWGIRLTCVQSAFDAQGTVLIREIESPHITAGQDCGVYTSNYIRLPITHDMDYTIIPDHQGEEYHRFNLPSTTYATCIADVACEPGFKAVSITVIGSTVNTSTVLNAEVIYNLELLPLIGTLTMKMATDAAPHSHAVLAAVHNTRMTNPLAAKSSGILAGIKALAQKALHAGGQFLLGPPGGMIADYISNKLKLNTQKLLTNTRYPAGRQLLLK
jgi:hypothetical protein